MAQASIRLARNAGLIMLLGALASVATAAPPAIATSESSRDSGLPAGGESHALPLRVPIKAVMAGIIDFSAHGVFRSATSETPLNDGDWLAAGLAALNLIASTTLITTPGVGPEDAIWVAQPEWRMWASQMQTASIDAGVAVRNRDRDALLSSADRLARACQSCHTMFRRELPVIESPRFASRENSRDALP
jgi:hypothetical protein